MTPTNLPSLTKEELQAIRRSAESVCDISSNKVLELLDSHDSLTATLAELRAPGDDVEELAELARSTWIGKGTGKEKFSDSIFAEDWRNTVQAVAGRLRAPLLAQIADRDKRIASLEEWNIAGVETTRQALGAQAQASGKAIDLSHECKLLRSQLAKLERAAEPAIDYLKHRSHDPFALRALSDLQSAIRTTPAPPAAEPAAPPDEAKGRKIAFKFDERSVETVESLRARGVEVLVIGQAGLAKVAQALGAEPGSFRELATNRARSQAAGYAARGETPPTLGSTDWWLPIEAAVKSVGPPKPASFSLHEAARFLHKAKEQLVAAQEFDAAAIVRDFAYRTVARAEGDGRWQAGLAKCVGQSPKTQGVGR